MGLISKIHELERKRIRFGNASVASQSVDVQNAVNHGIGLSSIPNIHHGLDYFDHGHLIGSSTPNIFGSYNWAHDGHTHVGIPNIFGGTNWDE